MLIKSKNLISVLLICLGVISVIFAATTPSRQPTRPPTRAPSSASPIKSPTCKPTVAPTAVPSAKPTFAPSAAPTLFPTRNPTTKPTAVPTGPSYAPTKSPTKSPSTAPSAVPSYIPSAIPSVVPSTRPTTSPTTMPTLAPKYTWVSDKVNVTSRMSTTLGTSTVVDFYININSNGRMYEDETGNFRLRFDYTNQYGLHFTGHTGCIKSAQAYLPTQKAINNVSMYYVDTLGIIQRDATGPVKKIQSLYQVKVKNYFNPHDDTTNYDYRLHVELRLKSRLPETLVVSMDTTGCAPYRTIGRWDDANRWSPKGVPQTFSEVIIPAGAGVIKLSANVSVTSLTMFGGQIVGYDTYCPLGWSVEPGGNNGIKCYKLFETPTNFETAERICNSGVGMGSDNRHLVHIRNRAELLVTQRMCRGIAGSAAHSRGCWIGLFDRYGTGNFRWLSALALGNSLTHDGMFLDWRRDEPNNHTISEGKETPGGERCAALVPWQEDPLLLEQGSWNDDSCQVLKPFVCQIFANTQRYTVSVAHSTNLTAGSLEGGVISTGTKATNITHFSAFRGGRLYVSPGGASCALGQVLLRDGASLSINSNAHTTGVNAHIGEAINGSLADARVANSTGVSPSFQDMQPNVRLAKGITLTLGLGAVHSDVTINARAFVDGTLAVASDTDVYLLLGADMSKATVKVSSVSSRLHLAGYNARLSTYDAYELNVAHRGEVTGEFYRDLAKEESNMHLGTVQGVYRLKVNATTTDCIPYNATAAELTVIFNKLAVVQQRGGVTVRRYGSRTDPTFRFGYTYRIEMDSVKTEYFAQKGLNVSVHCYGFDNACGCAETKVKMVDNTGMPQCPANNTVARRSPLSDPDACVIAPNVTIGVISTLSYAATSGAGSIIVEEGVHRFPPVSACTLGVVSGIGVVAADNIIWSGINVTGTGRLIAAGTSWDAWDASYALYAPEWTTKRGEVRALALASPFTMAVSQYYVGGLGSVLSACPSSNMTWQSGVWAGGIIGGRSTLNIIKTMNATGTGKSLRYGLTLFIAKTATLTWTNGNISLADGADITVEGKLEIDSTGSSEMLFIGEVQLLEAPASDASGKILLSQDPGRDWHGYFGDELAAELRGGWYQNPLCGNQCLATNHLTIRAQGVVTCTDNTNVTFSLPLDLIGQSKLEIRSNVGITMASGGICGNEVVVDISSGTKLELSGGQMLMEASCIMQGQGDLLVTGGSHDLAFRIDARITIEGGAMVWPDSRGSDKTITFNGGLTMQKTGQLIVNPFSTKILIYESVLLKDECLIQFPLIGIAAQASLFDEQDAPDPAPRGILTSNKTMTWEGGTLRGKADFKAVGELFLSGGTKYIKSLAKLVNQGHCEWGGGDLISSDSGDFLNLGTVQMMAGASAFDSNAMYQGTELPIENGGDVFALEYHSWDMDNGGLDYTQYVQERTKFVSRAPNGWTVSDQK